MMTIFGVIALFFALIHWLFLGGENMVPYAGCFLVSCMVADAGAGALYSGIQQIFNPEHWRK